jgi:hypothetical protein
VLAALAACTRANQAPARLVPAVAPSQTHETSTGDAPAKADAAATPPQDCPDLERFDLEPDPGPFERTSGQLLPYMEALRDDLVGPGVDARVVMVTTSSATHMPEQGVVVVRPADSATAKVTVRTYKQNVSLAYHRWIDQRPELKGKWRDPQVQRAAVTAVSREFDTVQADLDAKTFEAIARVWSLTLARTRRYTGRRTVVVHAHVGYYFRDQERSGRAGGRAQGSAADQLSALGKALISYADKNRGEPVRPDQLLAAATALEALLQRLQACPPPAP